jgi:hypothetical protein
MFPEGQSITGWPLEKLNTFALPEVMFVFLQIVCGDSLTEAPLTKPPQCSFKAF